jgi:SPOR domain
LILPADPTGRAERHTNRKLLRLLVLLAGVFVVGTGIGWIVGQIGHPVAPTTVQNVATSVPASLPPVSSPAMSGPPGADALAPTAPEPPMSLAGPTPAVTPPPAPPTAAAPPQPAATPQPAAATPTEQRTASNFIAEATQQPPPAAPPPSPPAASASAPKPAPAPPAPAQATTGKSEPEVVIEPVQEAPVPTAPAAPAKPEAKPAHAASKPHPSHPATEAKPARHHATPRSASAAGSKAGPSHVVVKGAKGAPAGTRWTVQLGAFRAHDHAAMLVMTLHSHGTEARVIRRDDGPKGVWYIVQTTPVSSLQAATKAANAISRREHVVAYVMRAPAS